MAEAWGGCFIALSVCSYARERWRVGLAMGLVSLYLRELAAPYVFACMLSAVLKRRWTELLAWSAGVAGYAVLYWIHWINVSSHHVATDTSHPHSWVAFGGFGFLLSTVGWQGWLSLLPSWATSLALTFIVAGILSPAAPPILRIATGLYTALFLAVGQPFNAYWGFLVWPSWCLAFGLGVPTLVKDILQVGPLFDIRTIAR
jgi:hypothetical protein